MRILLFPSLNGANNVAYDAWNKYGDDVLAGSNAVSISGLNINGKANQTLNVARTGYWEKDLVRPNVDNLKFDVGLNYLSLDRPARTLSGGESQRIRLATQIGTQLVGVLYILDEPSIGLHQRDNDRLIKSLEHLRDLGNTVIVVEHDREMMLAADIIADIGAGAGEYGGKLVAYGPPKLFPKS